MHTQLLPPLLRILTHLHLKIITLHHIVLQEVLEMGIHLQEAKPNHPEGKTPPKATQEHLQGAVLLIVVILLQQVLQGKSPPKATRKHLQGAILLILAILLQQVLDMDLQ